MICKRCEYESSSDFEICPRCSRKFDYECTPKGKFENPRVEVGKEFVLVNLIVFIGFNLIYFLIMGKSLYTPWGDLAYVFMGVPILALIEIVTNIYLCIKRKANTVALLFVSIVSLALFVSITTGLRSIRFY